MNTVQSYNPLDDIDDVLELTPFFVASKKHLAVTDSEHPQSKRTASNACAKTQTSSTKNMKPTRKSSRVRVV